MALVETDVWQWVNEPAVSPPDALVEAVQRAEGLPNTARGRAAARRQLEALRGAGRDNDRALAALAACVAEAAGESLDSRAEARRWATRAGRGRIAEEYQGYFY